VSKFSAATPRGLTCTSIPSSQNNSGNRDRHTKSHTGLPGIEKAKEQPDATELISDGVATVTMGHMALPLVVDDLRPALSLSISQHSDGSSCVASSAPRVLQTGCLKMDGVIDAYGPAKGAADGPQGSANVATTRHRICR
jgi:hypothetical protein